VIIEDDAVSGFVLSSFDGVRREVARRRLERAIADWPPSTPALTRETYAPLSATSRREEYEEEGAKEDLERIAKRHRPGRWCACSARCRFRNS